MIKGFIGWGKNIDGTGKRLALFFSEILSFFDHNRVWIPILIIGIIIFVFLLIIRKSELKKILSSIANIIQTGLLVVLDFLNHVVEAVKSASYFIYSIRLLLFEKPNKDITTHVLQASVFFLSIASYIATFSSMSIVVNRTIALFLTFSIQATIVAICINIEVRYESFKSEHAYIWLFGKKGMSCGVICQAELKSSPISFCCAKGK